MLRFHKTVIVFSIFILHFNLYSDSGIFIKDINDQIDSSNDQLVFKYTLEYEDNTSDSFKEILISFPPFIPQPLTIYFEKYPLMLTEFEKLNIENHPIDNKNIFRVPITLNVHTNSNPPGYYNHTKNGVFRLLNKFIRNKYFLT